ncbi:MAG: hypothetical protein E7603_02360 [Ruminococcaceae bacterium]|nr:hypothetical protein [Oscillospiraceae bacterium]
MKIAADYGFKADNDGFENARALQNAVLGGGEILIDRPGVYEIADTVMLDDGTDLRFCEGAYLKRMNNPDENGYVFINRGAYTKTYNENISVTGLKLICNDVIASPETKNSEKVILGLIGHCSFFYVKNLKIRNFECLDLPKKNFCIHICTFENVELENLRIEGMKDAVHFGRGKNFSVRHGIFRTFDDPIALNGHDYVNSNPELGWIENGIVEDCYDLDADSTTGYFCRILAGAWTDWHEGMLVQRSDTVVSEGRMYRVCMPGDGKSYRSVTRPTHKSGEKEYDGFVWAAVQEDITYTAGCRNIHFKDIHLQKKRSVAFSIHFDRNEWSRSYYPNAESPVQENITFENIISESEDLPVLLWTLSPVDRVHFKDCTLKNNFIRFGCLRAEGIVYQTTEIMLEGTNFTEEIPLLVQCAPGRSIDLHVVNSKNKNFSSEIMGDVRICESDISLGKRER